MRGSGGRWLLGWLAAAALLVGFRIRDNFQPGLGHDSFQYLSVAHLARHGAPGRTMLVHFDAERSFGYVPAPMVTFPLGYPMAMAGVMVTGLAPPRAALAVNVMALMACLILLWRLAGQMGLPSGVRHGVMALAAFNGPFILYTGVVSAEMLFIAAVLGALVLLWRAASGHAGHYLAAGLCLGAAYHVRYAGLFFVASLVPVMMLHWLRGRSGLVRGYLLAFAAALAVMMIGFARNVVLVGNWRGGNEKVVSNPVATIVFETARSLNNLLLGAYTGAPDVLHLLRATAILLVVAAVVTLIRRSRIRVARVPPPSGSREPFVLDLLVMASVYSALMFYAGITTVISYGTRMFVPVLPFLLLLAGVVAALAHEEAKQGGTRLPALALAGALALYIPLNLLSQLQPRVDRLAMVRGHLEGAMSGQGAAPGARLTEIIDSLAGTGGTIVANDGQAVGYALNHPTVSTVGQRFSNVVWTEDALRDVVARFRAAAVIITAPNAFQADDADLIPSDFIRQLAAGQPPPWLRLHARGGPMLVYQPVGVE